MGQIEKGVVVERNTNMMEIAILLIFSVIVIMAACGTEDDPANFFFPWENGGINYNYDEIAMEPYDTFMHDFYLDWEEEVAMDAP